MEDTLMQFLEQEQEQEQEPLIKEPNFNSLDTSNITDDELYDIKTAEYYKNLGFVECLTAAYFTFSSCYICGIEYLKYKIGWKTKTNSIIDIAKRLAAKNMLYVKMFQAYATNRTILNDELNQFFTNYTDNVEYTSEEYDVDDIKELERVSTEYYPFKQLQIQNDYKPIKSGLMSLIFKGVLTDPTTKLNTPIVIKYLRNNIHNKFNLSINNLVIFAKFTKKIPYIRTLNIENVILQNIDCLKDQICFRKEVANIQAYYNDWKDCNYIKIPLVYSEFTEKVNPNIIIMEYIDGIKLDEIDYDDCDHFGKLLASFNAKAAFCNSLYHGDLHPGNILFIKEPNDHYYHDDTTHNKDNKDREEIVNEYKYKIGILDFGIIGHMTKIDQEIMFNLTKMVYQKKFKKIINYIVFNISELLDQSKKKTNEVYDVKKYLKDDDYIRLCNELHTVFVTFAAPKIKFIGVTELYTVNYILNKYGLAFKRSLYKLLLTVAIMDSIGTRLGTNMSYVQYMTDIVVDLFSIESGPDVNNDDDHF
jgi:predicted unusual protein kinase regulating ubiquinone biosynthesis (AarF/ABC1/UbiB family)